MCLNHYCTFYPIAEDKVLYSCTLQVLFLVSQGTQLEEATLVEIRVQSDW